MSGIYKVSVIANELYTGEKSRERMYERVNNIMKGRYVGETTLISGIMEIIEREHKSIMAQLADQLERSTSPELKKAS